MPSSRLESKGARSGGHFELALTIEDGRDGRAIRAGWTVTRPDPTAKPGTAQDAADDQAVLAKVRELASAGQEPMTRTALRDAVPKVSDKRVRASLARLLGKSLWLGDWTKPRGGVPVKGERVQLVV